MQGSSNDVYAKACEVSTQAERISTTSVLILPMSFPKDRNQLREIKPNKTKCDSYPTHVALPRTPLMTSMACFGRVIENWHQIRIIDVQNKYESTLLSVEVNSKITL
jgi:hypothetical protein